MYVITGRLLFKMRLKNHFFNKYFDPANLLPFFSFIIRYINAFCCCFFCCNRCVQLLDFKLLLLLNHCFSNTQVCVYIYIRVENRYQLFQRKTLYKYLILLAFKQSRDYIQNRQQHPWHNDSCDAFVSIYMTTMIIIFIY